jgi:hypothetical protein
MDYRDYTSIGERNPLLLWKYCLYLSVDELATQNALHRQALHDDESCLDLDHLQLHG